MEITPTQAAELKSWFEPEEAGPLVGLHVIQTGNGTVLVDRWPGPGAVLIEAGGNYSLRGEPDAVEVCSLRKIVGFVDAPERFLPLLKSTFPGMVVWPRVTLELPGSPQGPVPGASVRRLGRDDERQLQRLSLETAWIWGTWGDAEGLTSSGRAWGAFLDGRIASVACTFFVGERYEEIGVVTEPDFRGLGLSPACAAALCAEIRDRGRTPSWTTSPDNVASLRVAEKLGFEVARRSSLYVVGMPAPEPARRESD